MNNQLFELSSEGQRIHTRFHRPRLPRLDRIQVKTGFTCRHCNMPVSSASCLSGVQNRNHCPYCLWSRHLDLYAAGDRLSACKSLMQPVGLTLKATRKRYGPARGELMLIHLCAECRHLSINRIAADDDSRTVLAVFDDSSGLEAAIRSGMDAKDIRALDARDRNVVLVQLFGSSSPVSSGRDELCSPEHCLF